MDCGRAALLLISVHACAIVAEARSLQHISPSLDPKSSKKFFEKDYPSDKRPGVDVLHFNHPYPVIQDSGDFDRDYVKDENSDSGNWEAQQEYDRLRHKLKRQKGDAAAALEKRREQDKDLNHAMKKYNQGVQDKEAAIAKAKEQEAQKKQKKGTEQDPKDDAAAAKGSSWSWSWWPFSWPKWGKFELPKSEPAPVVKEESGVRKATKDTEKAMDNLNDCKKELAKARSELEKLMDELHKAKATQSGAEAAVEQAKQKELQAAKLTDRMHDEVGKEVTEHATAEAAYLKQKARVDTMKAELEIVTAKVKAYRDAEDKGGGVYNTPSKSAKSLAIPMSSSCTAVFLLMVATCSWLA